MLKLRVIAGEGSVGTVKPYDGRMSASAVKAHLADERCGGDRWATIEIYRGQNEMGEIWERLEDEDLDAQRWTEDQDA